MSSFILEEKRIAQLADYIATLHNAGFDSFGYSIPEDLHKELLDCRDRYGFMEEKKIFKKLYELNAAAVAGRYNRDQEPTPEFPKDYTALHHPRQPRKAFGPEDRPTKYYYEEIQPWHYQLLKTLQCFLYQCNEDATYKDPLFLALKQLEPLMMNHIISNQPDYVSAQWAF